MKGFLYRWMALMALLMTATASYVAAQSVPQGIHYQAVARDNTGKEMSDRNIDVRFSVISGTPLGPVVYQELHQAVRTTRYGVFTLIVGSGIPTGGTVGELSQIEWGAAAHFLKVEVKFLNDFSDMGTMQFLAVPYALFAAKSLEPGPVGPQGQQGIQGPPGDPASDKQNLSFDGTNLTITGNPGNTVNLSALINDADASPTNEIQYLSLKGDTLSITQGNFVTFATLDIDDADADPTNEIQDLRLTGNILKITLNDEATEIDLTKYLDNTDEQVLTWNPATRILGLTNSAFTIDLSRSLDFDTGTNTLTMAGGNTVDLTSLKNDADSDPTNEIQDLELAGNILKITLNGEATEIDLTKYLDNTDEQVLTWDPATRILGLSNSAFTIDLSRLLTFDEATGILTMAGGNTVDLTSLKNDADSDPTNEIQDLSLTGDVLKITNNASASNINLGVYRDNTDNQTLEYDPATYNLSVSGGNSVSLGGMVAFRAGISTSLSVPNNTPVNLVFDQITGGSFFNGTGYDPATGAFEAPTNGIYSFNISLTLPNFTTSISAIYLGETYEMVIGPTTAAGNFRASIMMRLNKDDTVNFMLVQNSGILISPYIISGTFSGFRVY